MLCTNCAALTCVTFSSLLQNLLALLVLVFMAGTNFKLLAYHLHCLHNWRTSSNDYAAVSAYMLLETDTSDRYDERCGWALENYLLGRRGLLHHSNGNLSRRLLGTMAVWSLSMRMPFPPRVTVTWLALSCYRLQ